MDLSPEKTRGLSLADHWELDQEHKRGVFNFRPHHVNYLMVTRTAHPNNEPYRPFRDLGDFATDLSHNELVFQLGFKTKLVETAFDKPVDLWFGYTQNSFWQAGNRKASSPFRETNYQPELMAVMPLDVNLLGMHASFLNLGLAHQSNGRIRPAGHPVHALRGHDPHRGAGREGRVGVRGDRAEGGEAGALGWAPRAHPSAQRQNSPLACSLRKSTSMGRAILRTASASRGVPSGSCTRYHRRATPDSRSFCPVNSESFTIVIPSSRRSKSSTSMPSVRAA